MHVCMYVCVYTYWALKEFEAPSTYSYTYISMSYWDPFYLVYQYIPVIFIFILSYTLICPVITS